MKTPQTLGGRVAWYRRNEGLSRAALARLCGLSSSALRRIEADSRSPTVRTLEQIAQALGISSAHLLGEQRLIAHHADPWPMRGIIHACATHSLAQVLPRRAPLAPLTPGEQALAHQVSLLGDALQTIVEWSAPQDKEEIWRKGRNMKPTGAYALFSTYAKESAMPSYEVIAKIISTTTYRVPAKAKNEDDAGDKITRLLEKILETSTPIPHHFTIDDTEIDIVIDEVLDA